jgi:hypothetical protein
MVEFKGMDSSKSWVKVVDTVNHMMIKLSTILETITKEDTTRMPAEDTEEETTTTRINTTLVDTDHNHTIWATMRTMSNEEATLETWILT